MSRAKFPRRIRVIGRWWTVRRPYRICHPEDGGALADGMVIFDEHLILIRRGLRLEDAREVLWHEIKHVLIECLAINPRREGGHHILSILEDAVKADNPAFSRLYTWKRKGA